MTSLTMAADFEWMNSSSSNKKRGSFLLTDEPEYEEDIQFTRKRNASKGKKKAPPTTTNRPSSPLMNFKLLDLTSFDEETNIGMAGSSSTEGALMDPAEAPLYEQGGPLGNLARGQDAWVRCNFTTDAGTVITSTTTATSKSRWDSYKEDMREDPECEYFDLTALSSEDVATMPTTGTRSSGLSYNSQGQRDPASRYTYEDELDEYGRHPSDYYDLTVLSEEEETAFDQVFKVVSHVKQKHKVPAYSVEATPLTQDIVDLTANSVPDAPILDLTGLTGDGPEDEQLTENGSVLVDLTHVQLSDEYDRDEDWHFSQQGSPAPEDAAYQDPFPSLPGNVRSCDSQGSNASSYRSGSFDWMTQSGTTSGPAPAAQARPPPRQTVRWLDQQGEQQQGNQPIKKKSPREPKGTAKTQCAGQRDPEGVKKSGGAEVDPKAESETEVEAMYKALEEGEEEEQESESSLDGVQALSDDEDGTGKTRKKSPPSPESRSRRTSKATTDVKTNEPDEESIPQKVAQSTAVVATSFFDMLLNPATAMACQAPPEKPFDSQSHEEEETDSNEEDSNADHEKDSPEEKERSARHKQHGHQDEDSLKEDNVYLVKEEHYDLTANNSLCVSKSQEDIEDPQGDELLEKTEAEDWRNREPSKESVVKRERIEKLRMQRRKRQQHLNNMLEGGRRQMPEGLSEEKKTQDDAAQDEIEVAIVQDHTKKKGKKDTKSKSKGESTVDKAKFHDEDKKKTEKSKHKTKANGDKRKTSKKKKKTKKGKTNKSKPKPQSGLVTTWQRVKASLQPWKKRDVALFTPSSEEESDTTEGDNKIRREEVRRSIEQAAIENVRSARSSSDTKSSDKIDLTLSTKSSSSKSSKKGKKCLKASRKAGWKPKEDAAGIGPQYDGDADTASEHESRRGEYLKRHLNKRDGTDATDEPYGQAKDEQTQVMFKHANDGEGRVLADILDAAKVDLQKLSQMDLDVQRTTAAAAHAAIAIAAASRGDKSGHVTDCHGQQPEHDPIFVEQGSYSSEFQTDDLVEESPGNFFFTEKEKSVGSSQFIQDQPMESTSFYSTAAEETENMDDINADEDEDDYKSAYSQEDSKSFRSVESYPSMASRASAISSKSNKSIQWSLPRRSSRHSSTSGVTNKSAIIVDPYGYSGRLDNGATPDLSWLYGNDVKLPFFLHACMHCPTGGCCDLWHSSSHESPETKHPSKDIKSSDDSHTYTTSGGSTISTPIACWYPSVECISESKMQTECVPVRVGDIQNAFGTVPERLYNDLSCQQSVDQSCSASWINPAGTDTERSTSPPPPINSTINLVYHACGIALHTQKDAVTQHESDDNISDQSPVLPLSCGHASAHDGSELMIVPDQCGALQNAARGVNAYAVDALLGPCITGKPSKGNRKKSGDSISSKSKRRGRRSRRRNKHRDEDSIEETIPYSYEPAQAVATFEKNKSEEKVATYEGITQATEDAFALLSKQAQFGEAQDDENADEIFESSLPEEAQPEEAPASPGDNMTAQKDDRSAGESQESSQQDPPSRASTQNTSNIGGRAPDASEASLQDSEKSAEGSLPSSQQPLTVLAKEALKSAEASLSSSRRSLMEASRNSSLFTPSENSFEDISLGYSVSNMDGMDAWSLDGHDNKVPSPPRQKKKSAEAKTSNKNEGEKEKENKQAKEAKAILQPTTASQPISNFVMSIFGEPPRSKEEAVPDKTPQVVQEERKQSLTDALATPKSLRSLASYNSNDSEDYDIASDRSMSSLSTSLNGTGKPSSSLDRKRLELIVSELMAHPNGFIFSSPVDPKLFPDYRKKVKKPMDLGTVLKRLLSAGYPNLLDFHGDVSLIFENAMLYNAEGTKVHDMALELKESFETTFLDLLDQLEAELIEKEEARVAI